MRALEAVLWLTSFAAGAVDVISFARLGGVLTSAMTGNIALLGLYVGSGVAGAALRSVVALSGFIIGTAAAALVARGRAQSSALKILLAAELALLFLGALLWMVTGQASHGFGTYGVIMLLALAMGAQIIVGRQLNLSGVPTVVFTSTLANIITGLTDVFARRVWKLPPDALRQCVSLALYFAGALVAGIWVCFGMMVPMVLPIIAVGAAFVAMRYA